jgi:hypothetical protein
MNIKNQVKTGFVIGALMTAVSGVSLISHIRANLIYSDIMEMRLQDLTYQNREELTDRVNDSRIKIKDILKEDLIKAASEYMGIKLNDEQTERLNHYLQTETRVSKVEYENARRLKGLKDCMRQFSTENKTFWDSDGRMLVEGIILWVGGVCMSTYRTRKYDGVIR